MYINYSIKLFIDAWSAHPLRTERNRSPMQLWVERMMINAKSGTTATEELYLQELPYTESVSSRFVKEER